MSRVVVTGAAGRLGSAVVRDLLLVSGVQLTRFVSLADRSEVVGATTVQVDLRKPKSIRDAIEQAAPTVVVHLGGMVPRDMPSTPDFAVNHISTTGLVEALKGTSSRIILASTAAVYGDRQQENLTETSSIDLQSDYARSKYLAEQELLDSSGETVALRIFNIFGPGFTDSLVSKLIAATPENPIVFLGWDGFVRDYIHVADVVSAVRKAVVVRLPQLHVTLNIGSGMATSNADLVRVLSVRQPVHFSVAGWRISRSVAAVVEAEAVLGFTASRLLTFGGSLTET
ncbi:MAG: NAD-dependent epimerase/dehydratase family protein [Rhodoglobus sp.]